MIQPGDQIRFTATEIEEGYRLGLDLSGVRTSADLSAQLVGWIEAMSILRFEVVEKLALELAKLKGISLPPHLAIVRSDDAPSGDSKSSIGTTD
jgi:hypothetical protein